MRFGEGTMPSPGLPFVFWTTLLLVSVSWQADRSIVQFFTRFMFTDARFMAVGVVDICFGGNIVSAAVQF